MTAYEELLSKLREHGDLQSIEQLLGWDQQTYMPPGGNDARARHIAMLSAMAHRRLTDPRLAELIEQCGADPDLSEEQKAQLRETKRERDKAVKLPEDLVREIAETAVKAHVLWAEAREKDDFTLFSPILKSMIDLKKREAEALGYGEGVAYDALLDQFEPGASVAELNPIIERTREITQAAVDAIRGSAQKPDTEILKRGYAASAQEKFGLQVLKAMGYDLTAGRLDKAVHPFTTSFDTKDVRITTRYQEDWLPASVFGSIHEGGHALYEQGLPAEHVSTPLGDSLSLGYHESQSRFFENIMGRGRPFWEHFYPSLKESFPNVLRGVELDDFHFAINTVEPSLIRVEADEVTYNLHIIIRYEIEQAIFAGEASVDDLPQLWNEKIQSYLGLTPPNNTLGVLQDIHWSLGAFGYFPTYLLGNLYAAQWSAAIRRDMPDMDQRIAGGDLLPIRDWMREKIHRHGRRYPANELAVMISGESLNPEYFDAYLKERFSGLYGVSW